MQSIVSSNTGPRVYLYSYTAYAARRTSELRQAISLCAMKVVGAPPRPIKKVTSLSGSLYVCS
jgi:hypothetical protein